VLKNVRFSQMMKNHLTVVVSNANQDSGSSKKMKEKMIVLKNVSFSKRMKKHLTIVMKNAIINQDSGSSKK